MNNRGDLKGKHMDKFRNFFFDLDGTLVEFNIDFQKIREVLNIKGKYILESLKEDGERERKNEILKEFEIKAAKKAKLEPFAKEIIDELNMKNCKKGIVTRNCKESAEIIVNRFKLDVDFIISREDTEPKPSPAPLFRALELTNGLPSNSAIIGDYKFDLLSGRAAGIKSILVITEQNKEVAYDFVHLADYVVSGLDEIRMFIG